MILALFAIFSVYIIYSGEYLLGLFICAIVNLLLNKNIKLFK